MLLPAGVMDEMEQPTETSVNITRSCKYSLELLMIGKNIA
jgi:hypothetical protein